MSLGIKKSAWHFKYYTTLKRLWGMDLEQECKSVCPYAHVLFWCSILTLVFSPFILIGWLCLKASRLLYKTLNASNTGAKIIDYVDGHFEGGEKIEDMSEMAKKSPVLATAAIGIVYAVFILMALTILGTLVFGFGWLIWSIPKIPAAIWFLIIHFFNIVFNICAFIGLIMHYTGIGLSIAAVWLATHIGAIGFWFSYIIAILVVITIIVYILIKVLESKQLQGFRDWLTFKYNGFQEARKIAKKRREVEKTAREPDEGVYKPKKTTIWSKIWKFLGSFFSEKVKTLDKREINVLGVFAIIWLFLKSIKQGICPMVEFINDEQISTEKTKDDNDPR